MRLLARVLLPLVLLGYIATQTYMKLHHTSLCDATGCKLAGELLRFDPMYLYYFGAAGAALLALFGALGMRSERFAKLFRATLTGALAFESVMLSYQIAVNPEPCLFCMGVFGGLMLIALLEFRANLLLPLAVSGGVAVAVAMLATVKNEGVLAEDATYLFFSPTCPHCKKVKRYFAEHRIDYRPISVRDASARRVLHYLGIDKIPVLVVKQGERYDAIVGDEAIIAHYQSASTQASSATPETTVPDLSSGATGWLQQGGDEGCALSVVPEPTCSENNDS